MKRLSACLVVLAVACGPSVGGGGSGSGESGGSSESSSSESGLPDTGTGGPNVCGDDQLGDEGFCFDAMLIELPGGGVLDVGNVDGEGGDDIVVGARSPNQITTLFGNANVGLELGPTTFPQGDSLNHVFLADIDANGTDDLLVTRRSEPEIWTDLGDGTGEFDLTISVVLETGNPLILRAVDWIGDGRLDLVFETSAPGGLGRLEQTSAGQFAVADYGTTGQNDFGPFDAGGIAVGHFGGDAGLDLAAVVIVRLGFPSLETLRVYLDNAVDPLEITPPDSIAPGTAPEAADLDGDGTDEIIMAGWTGFGVYGVRDGTLVELYREDETMARAIATGDLDGDGLADVVMAVGLSLRILAGWSDNQPAVDEVFEMSDSLGAIAVGDFNNDGLADIAGVANGTPSVAALLSNP